MPSEVVVSPTGKTDKGKAAVRPLNNDFEAELLTAEAQRAVDDGVLSIPDALKLIRQAEVRYGIGSAQARRIINSSIGKARARRRVTKKHRAPRPPIFHPTPKPPSFLVSLQRQLLDWTISQIDPALRARHEGSALYARAVSDFIADVRTAATDLRSKLRRLGHAGAFDAGNAMTVVAELNRNLDILGMAPARRADEVDLDEVRRTHRKLARLFHPDLNEGAGMRERFERVHQAYERVLELSGAG